MGDKKGIKNPKGSIKKVVQYHRIQEAEDMIFNLAFGDWNEKTCRIDEIKSNNSDREKILATVAATVIQFTDEHPQAVIYMEGSTPARTRLYQMIKHNIFDMGARNTKKEEKISKAVSESQ